MKYLLTFFLSAILLVACASSAEKTIDTMAVANATVQTAVDYDQGMDVPAGADSMQMIFNLSNQPNGVAKLVGMFEDQRFIVDSVTIDNKGHFELTRQKLLPAGYYYFILPGQKAFHLLIDRDQRFEITGDMNDIFNTATVKGSTCLELFYRSQKYENSAEFRGLNDKLRAVGQKLQNPPSSQIFKEALPKFNELMKTVEENMNYYTKNYPSNFFTKFKLAGKNPKLTYPAKSNGTLDTVRQVYNFRNAFWTEYDFNTKGLLRTPVFANKIKKYFKNYVPKNQDSIILYTDKLVAAAGDNFPYFRAITNWVALKYEPTQTTLMDGEAVYAHIIKKYFTNEKATWSTPDELAKLRKRASEMEMSLLNKPAQNVTANDIHGKPQTLLDSKADILVVFIYSPDCEHCREQIPKLINMYKKWKAQGESIDVYSISANTTEKEWRDFNRQFNMPFPDVFDPTNASWYPKYFVDITPEVYVLDKNRKIVAKNIKVDQIPIIINKHR